MRYARLVNRDGLALQYASEEMRNDMDVVFAAVKQHGMALLYALDKTRNDRDVIFYFLV